MQNSRLAETVPADSSASQAQTETARLNEAKYTNARSAIVLAVLVIPCLLALLWHLCNHSLPNDDAANFAGTALSIVQDFEKGPVAGVASALNTRGWRPTLFPVLAVPFLLATGGDITAATAALLLLIQIALAFYLYRLARFCAAGPLTAATASSVVLTLPIVMTYSLVYFSESAWLLASIACVYHLLRSGPFEDPVHSFSGGLFGGLMIAIRPAESIPILFLVLAVLVTRQLQSKKLQPGQVMLTAALFSVPLLLLVLSIWASYVTRLVIWAVCFGVLIAGVLQARSRSKALVAFSGALTAVSCFWWAGYMPHLFSWVYDTSFGRMAQVTDRRSAAPAMEAVMNLARPYGLIQLLFLVGLAAVSIVALVAERRRGRKTEGAATPVMLLLWISVLALSVFGALYVVSGTGDPRRIMVAVVLSIVCLIVIAGSWSRIALASALGVFGVQAMFIGSVVADHPQRVFNGEIGSIPSPHRHADGNIQAASVLPKFVPPGSNIAVYTLALFRQDARVYEPAALQVACLNQRRRYVISYLWDSGAYAETIGRLQKARFNYLLLDSYSEIAPQSSHMPYVQFASELLHRMQSGRLESSALRRVASFELGGRNHTLFRILQPEGLLWEDSIAGSINGARAIATSESGNFSKSHLNDGTEAAWGSAEGMEDVYAGVVLPSPHPVRIVRFRLFTPAGRPHLRNIRIVAAESETPGGPQWRFLAARLRGEKTFSKVVTVPPLADNSEVVIEVDSRDPNARAWPIWGFGCLRAQGDAPNYLPVGTGVYVREMSVE